MPTRAHQVHRPTVPAGAMLALGLLLLASAVAAPPVADASVAAAGPAGPLVPSPMMPSPPDPGPAALASALEAARGVLASPYQGDPATAVDACVAAEMAEEGTPGASIAILRDGRIVHARGYGKRHPTQGGEIDTETHLRIGSETKMMTAAAVMQLVEAGQVDLQAPVTTYLPELRFAPPWQASDVTLKHLLTHSSGIPDTYLVDPDRTMSLADWAGYTEFLPLAARPGSFWNYTNPGYSLAGLVVERVSGMPFATYLRDRVWRPAGMLSTTLSATEVISGGNYATGYDPATGTEYGPQYLDIPAVGPAGTALSTPGDMVRWAELLMSDGEAVLAASSAQAMQSPQMAMDLVPWVSYGYGIFVWDYADASEPARRLRVLEHGGNAPGWSAQLFWVPERRLAVSVMGTSMASLDRSAHCALAAYGNVEPIADEVPPSPRAEWEAFEGTYAMMNTALWDFTATITAEDDGMHVRYGDIGGRYVLTPGFGDTFHLDQDGDGRPDLDMTFIRDRADPGRTRYLRFRTLVGERVGTMPAEISISGDGCADLPVTAGMAMPHVAVRTSGLTAPMVFRDQPLTADPPMDPAGSAFKHAFDLQGTAGLFFVALTHQVDDAVGLYVLRDADANGTFQFPNEIIGIGVPASATTSLVMLSGRPPGGRYEIWVHGASVVGESSTFTLTANVSHGTNLTALDPPRALAEDEQRTLRVCARDTAGLSGTLGGLVELDYGYAPRRARIAVRWQPAGDGPTATPTSPATPTPTDQHGSAVFLPALSRRHTG